MHIICSDTGIIIEIGNELLHMLEYEKDELIGQFIGIIMNPMMEKLHKTIFLPKLENASTVEKNRIYNFLSSMKATERPLMIYTKSKQCIYVSLTIIHFKNNFIVTFTVIHNTNNVIYTSLLVPPVSTSFKLNSLDLVVISLDIKDSTEFLVEHGIVSTIALHSRFHYVIVEIIKQHFYPYLFIHEIMGDGFILVINLDWTYNYPTYATTIAHHFLLKLYEKTHSFIKFRAGVSYGPLYYGYMDSHLRFFGETINIACRCENQYKEGYYCSSLSFYDKLSEESQVKLQDKIIEKVVLKGLGEHRVVFIPLRNIHLNDLNDLNDQ